MPRASVVSRNFGGYPVPFQALYDGALRGDQEACFELLPLGVEQNQFPVLSRCVPQVFPRSIPKHVVQFWDSPDPPDDVRAAMDGLRAINPDFTFQLECDASARAFIQDHYGAEITALYDACPHPAMRSDFWRLCHLNLKGGIYIDADVVARAPLTDITRGTDFRTLLSYSVGSPWCLDNDVLIQEAGHPLMRHIMETMFQRVRHVLETGSFENVWVSTGPGAMVVGTMNWIARALHGHEIPFSGINRFLSIAGLAFVPHPQVEQTLDTCAPFAYQNTDANWREFLTWPGGTILPEDAAP